MNTVKTLALPLAFLLAACADPAGVEDGPADDSNDGDDSAAELQEFTACEQEFTLEDPNPNYPWTPNAVELVSEELAPGVFGVYDSDSDQFAPAGIPLATSAGFVIGDDSVLLVDTMINRQLFCQLIDLVREETDLPVRYAINTSYHGDHSYGNVFLPDEVEVVQHERTAEFIAENFEADVAFMEANFGVDQVIDEIRAVVPDIAVSDAGWSVDLGGVSVEARYYGFGQTIGDLFVYVPEANVMWTGNPLIAEPPAIPWLLDGQGVDVRSTLIDVRDDLPAGAIVVPGHGRPVNADGFEFSIDYLDAMITGVEGAIEDGLSVEQTVEAVSMDDFQGYVLWDWVHSVLNVPTTFGELSN